MCQEIESLEQLPRPTSQEEDENKAAMSLIRIMGAEGMEEPSPLLHSTELKAAAAISSALLGLSPRAQMRVLIWMCAHPEMREF